METLKEYNLTYEEVVKLNEHAIKVVQNCHAVYSNFMVGAAILSDSGKIVEGVNVENVSYGGSICAERAAVFRFKAEGEKQIRALSVYIKAKNYDLYPTPCGMCRQIMAEFGYFPIICCKAPQTFIVKSVASMLPYTFRHLECPKYIYAPDPKDLNQVIDAAQYWLQMDPDIKTRQEVERWLANDDYTSMRKYLCKRIDFGTAGLRGEMGAGYSRMNYLVVQQSAQGIAKYLLQTYGPEVCKERGVVIGYDGRHNSKGYAHISAAVFKHYGVKCLLFDDYVMTPMVPYTTVKRNCLAGIMVTASHNPKQDNGYKVYWTNGAQIIEPHDRNIREHINQNLALLDLGKYYDYEQHLLKEKLEPLREKLMGEYMEAAVKRVQHNPKDLNEKCKSFVYTAMHGVGYIFTKAILVKLGFKEPIPVKEQVIPDPEFPTVVYPNPEEGEGALRLAMKTADANGCDYIMANDPDADRFAMAERQKDGTWKIFTGDQIGSIFAHYLVKSYKGDLSKCAMVASTVSSKLIKGIATKYGVHFEETLTGFKWIANKVLDLEKAGYNVLFSYEEAIGFCVGDVVRDKDGVSAAGCLAELYAQLCTRGSTFTDYLEEVYKDVGYYMTKNHYFLCYDPEKMKTVFEGMRNGGKFPTKCGEFEISHIRDLTVGYDSMQPDKKPILPVSKSTQMITFFFANGATCTIRGSGTEPKLKFYIEYHDAEKAKAAEVLAKLHKAIVDNFLRPTHFGLEFPKA